MFSTDVYFFSATGKTKKVIDCIAEGLALKPSLYNLTNRKSEFVATGADLKIFVAPVYMGRLPQPFTDKITSIKGKGRAVAVVVYGNRDYEDALLELKNILEEQGYQVIAGAAFSAQHTFVPELAQGRPDEKDREAAIGFAKKLSALMEKETCPSIEVKGNFPYKEIVPSPLTVPFGDEKCDDCGTCYTICPMNAISSDEPTKTDSTKCISCMLCVTRCTRKARDISEQVKEALKQRLMQFAARKEPEFFF